MLCPPLATCVARLLEDAGEDSRSRRRLRKAFEAAIKGWGYAYPHALTRMLSAVEWAVEGGGWRFALPRAVGHVLAARGARVDDTPSASATYEINDNFLAADEWYSAFKEFETIYPPFQSSNNKGARPEVVGRLGGQAATGLSLGGVHVLRSLTSELGDLGDNVAPGVQRFFLESALDPHFMRLSADEVARLVAERITTLDRLCIGNLPWGLRGAVKICARSTTLDYTPHVRSGRNQFVLYTLSMYAGQRGMDVPAGYNAGKVAQGLAQRMQQFWLEDSEVDSLRNLIGYLSEPLRVVVLQSFEDAARHQGSGRIPVGSHGPFAI